MNKRYSILFFSILLSASLISIVSVAQNPRRTEYHRQQSMKKASIKSTIPRSAHYGDKDADGDGILDINDKCPGVGVKGDVTPFGCPMDTDYDGVYDAEDPCINQAGPVENHGCPWADTDGDGVPDKDDKCLTVKGIPEYDGCPDTDGDGIIDLDDNCPKEKGVLENHGCPPKDTDNDGIPDSEDLCPKTPGLIELKGCPALKQEEKEALKRAFDNLLFKTGSDIIDESSFSSLNDLARIMINNPTQKLRLEGHTDDVGEDAANLDLSKRRAASVKTYLTNKGVDGTRVSSEGYGETKPKLPNISDGNRKVNRRVEMILAYE